MTPYDRIAAAIRYAEAHQAEQPSLDRLAQAAGLSPFHFHRLFRAWAGVTPKDFLQCLTLSHARALLKRGRPVLDSALGAGLSGAGRLHDLTVSLEAASPGELRSGGAGWTLRAGVASSPFGDCLLAESPRGLCHLTFIDSRGAASAWRELQMDWPNARLQRDDAWARRQAVHIFRWPRAERTPLRAFVRGTPFQVRVWKALFKVGPGQLTSYGRLAAAIGQPRAARAVGSAVGRNPLCVLIPCHRVIRDTGVIGDYRWGAVRKRALLAAEQARLAKP